MFFLNASVPLQFKVYNASGVLADATTVTVTISREGAVVAGPTVITSSPAGVYTYFGPSTVAGRYTVSWVATGANATDRTDQYDVRPADSTALLSLYDAKLTLNYDQTVTIDDDELTDYLEPVTSLIEKLIGPVIPRSVTETVQFARSSFSLRKPPVISLTSITPVLTNGIAYSVSDFTPLSGGQVVRQDGTWLVEGPYTVVYQAGRTGAIDPDILQAARLLLQHFWRTQRGQGRPGQAADDGYGAAYTIPNRVLELLGVDPDRQMGIA